MREPKKGSIWQAALLALAAGALVALANPARPIAHEASIALDNAAELTAGAAHLARDELVAQTGHRA